MVSSRKNSISENRITPVECERVSSSTVMCGEGETLFHAIAAQKCVTDEDFQKMINIHGRGRFYTYLTKIDANGNTPIHAAAQSGNVNFISNSFKHFDEDLTCILALPIVRNNEGKTPLHLAVDGEHLECIKVLIKYISEYVNMQDIQGRTPLHNAILFKKNIKIVKELLKYPHINTEIKDNHDHNVHNYVQRSTDKKIVNLFIDYYNNKTKEVMLERRNSDIASRSSAYLSKICNNVTVGFSTLGGLIALVCEFIPACSTISECDYNTANKCKTASVIFYSIASLLFPCALFLHYRSSNYKEKHDLLSDDIGKYRMQTSELVKAEQRLCRQDSINEKMLSNITTQLQKSGYIRQVRSAEVSIRIQENDSIQRTTSCGAQMYPKGKDNEEPPYTILQSSNLSVSGVSYGRLQE